MSSSVDRADLEHKLASASGGDPDLDRLVAAVFGVTAAPFTEAVEPCRALVASQLPGWHLHVGFGVSGVLPYAALSDAGHHVEAEAPTVPLAILRALLRVSRP